MQHTHWAYTRNVVRFLDVWATKVVCDRLLFVGRLLKLRGFNAQSACEVKWGYRPTGFYAIGLLQSADDTQALFPFVFYVCQMNSIVGRDVSLF